MIKLLHTSDWHLGRIFHGRSLIEDQKHMLDQILSELKSGYDALLIAGDLFDRAVPPPEAITLLDSFLRDVADLHISTVIIPGNHDSSVRLRYGAALFEKHGIHIRCDYQQSKPVVITGKNGSCCDLFTLPFVDHILVRDHFPDREMPGKEAAIQALLDAMRCHVRDGVPAILMAHEYVDGATASDSERVYVGGSHVVSPALFDGFTFVALGHLHRMQKVKSETIHYCGSPLPYSFAEAENKNGLLSITIDESSAVTCGSIEIHPLRPVSVIEDTFDRLMNEPAYELKTRHYLSARITDEQYHHELRLRLRERFPYLLEVRLLHVEKRISSDTPLSIEHQDDPRHVFEAFLRMFDWDNEPCEQAVDLVTQALSSKSTKKDDQ